MVLTVNQTAAVHEAIRDFIKTHDGATPEKVFDSICNRYEAVTLVAVKAYLDSIGHFSRPEQDDGAASLIE